MIGASNALFRQQTNHQFILNDNEEEFLIQSSDLRQQLQLTTADLRFTQLFEDGQSSKFNLSFSITNLNLNLNRY
jgi:hypothetical protein